MLVAYTITHNTQDIEEDSVFIQCKGKAPVIISRKDGKVRFANLISALERNDEDEIARLIDVQQVMQQLTHKSFRMEGDVVYYKNNKLPEALSNKLVSMYIYGEPDIEKYYKFVERVWENPSERSRNELFSFLQTRELPILDDGRFLAYKGVSGSYKDQHSGMFDNTVGNVHKMDRDKVDPDKTQHCSVGFHVGSYEYAKGFMSYGGHLMFVAVDPYYVVSVPEDENCEKCRVSQYEVIGEDHDLVELERPVYERSEDGSYDFSDTYDDYDEDVQDNVTRMYIQSAVDRFHFYDINPTIKQISETINLPLDYQDIYYILEEMGYDVEEDSESRVQDIQVYKNDE